MTAIDLAFDEDEILASDINGYIALAPIGTTGPVYATDDPNAAFVSIGLLSDNGIVTSYGRDSTAIQSFNVRGDVKRIAKNASFSFKFSALQTNPLAVELYYGNAPVAVPSHTGNFSTKILAKSDVTERAYLIDVPMDDGTFERTYLPRGVITATEDITYSQSAVKEYGFTVSAVVSPGVDYLGLILSNAVGLSG